MNPLGSKVFQGLDWLLFSTERRTECDLLIFRVGIDIKLNKTSRTIHERDQ